MANIIKGVVKAAKKSWKQGIGYGSLSGVLTGLPLMLGAHPFVAYFIGGGLSAAFTKDDTSRKIILLESSREAIINLMAGE